MSNDIGSDPHVPEVNTGDLWPIVDGLKPIFQHSHYGWTYLIYANGVVRTVACALPYVDGHPNHIINRISTVLGALHAGARHP